jgi:CubicO group peptidase (beta-lactamase class C family)
MYRRKMNARAVVSLVRGVHSSFLTSACAALLLAGCASELEADEKVGSQSAALATHAPFSDAGVWTVITGSASVVDGGASVRLADIGGYVEVQNSNAFGTLTAEGEVRLDINIPDLPWGHVALYFDIPSRGIYRQYVGPVDLTELPAGRNELSFTVPQHIATALAGSYDDFKLGIAFAVPTGTTIALHDLCFSSCDEPNPEPLSWTSRDMFQLRNIGWSSHRGLSLQELSDNYAERSAAGQIPLNIGAKRKGGGPEFSIVWRDNVDDRGWKAHWNLTSAEYHALWEQYRDQGYRPLNVTGYRVTGGNDRFAGIWVENRENLGWVSYRGLTHDEYGDFFQEWRDKGYRPIDLEMYETGDGPRIATIWYENVDNVAWAQFRNMSRERYQQEVDDRGAAGYLMIDYDSYDGDDEYAAIWEIPAVARPPYQIRTRREDPDFANYWRQYRDEGYRPFHVENHGDNSNDHFAGIWVQNLDRFDYDRKGDIDNAVDAYRSANDIPGISVAVIRGGEVLYQRGFGWADVDDEKAAHGQTVYNAASVSKVVGGTLAAKLEAEGVLRSGASVSLDMTLPTSSFLTGIPAHHTHTVEELTAHLSCVAHYDTSPDIDNLSGHYPTALAAAKQFWNTGLVSSCPVASGNPSYSTPGFTLLGAVLEDVTGERIADLVKSEITVPYGLTSMRPQWETIDSHGIQVGVMRDDYERAKHYDDDNDEDDYDDTSWKVLGGGIETNPVDLARFGWLVLSGQVVSPAVRDNRLFAPVSPGCGPDDTGGLCSYGVAWNRGYHGARRIVEHGGSQTGARSHLRLYRDDDLVIALMSNRTEHDIWTLCDSIGDIVLAP